MIMFRRAISAQRWRLPQALRVKWGVPCEGDQVRCPSCGGVSGAQVVPDPLALDGTALICGVWDCDQTLDSGYGMSAR